MKANKHDDVMHGTAGTILALVNLYEVTQNEAALECALFSGEQIITRHFTNPVQKTNPKWLTGFSHGVAGISYALFKLYARSGVQKFYEAGYQFVTYERDVYSKAHNNWPDFRSTKPTFLNSWCHGATGIGLARIGSLEYIKDETMLQEIEQAIELTLRDPYTNVTHLCCGNFGRLEFLLTYTTKIAQTKNTLTDTYFSGMFPDKQWKDRLLQQPLSPGFFLGFAGIGYQMLRLIAPHTYPSILLFE